MTRTARAVFALSGALVAASCAAPTPYVAAAGDRFGYSDQTLETDRRRVRFAGNSLTGRGTVEDFVLHRAAELTLAEGGGHFLIVSEDVERDTFYTGTLAGFDDYGASGWRDGFGTGVGSYSAFPRDRYTAYAEILIRKGEKPADAARAYDAKDVLRRLGPSIVEGRGD